VANLPQGKLNVLCLTDRISAALMAQVQYLVFGTGEVRSVCVHKVVTRI
jgi:hypothetical protein